MFAKSLQRLFKAPINRAQLRALQSAVAVQRRHISAQSTEEGKIIIVQSESQAEGEGKEEDTLQQSMKFPAVWLRENCKCPECFHASSQSRRINWSDFDTRVKVQEIETDKETKQLKIKWSDQHSSAYDLQWLKNRDFSAKQRAKYLNGFYRPKTQHWSGKDFNKITEILNFQDVMQNDGALKSWLEALAVRGVALIKDSPIDKGVVRQLADRVGFIRKTTYGEEFIVQSKPGAKNFAYLSDPLPLHTDLPYYEYKPSVNLLHCMEQTLSTGGDNLLVDAFYVADRLRAEHPKDFDILTQTLVDWNDIGSEDGSSFHNIWRAPVICLDGNNGCYTRINHSIPQRDSHFTIPLEEVQPWYEAYAKFVRLAHEESHAFKTKPGDILTFNNIRLLHGRTSYDDTEQNVRYIVGAYLDWDIIYSKLRVLIKADTMSLE